MQEGEKQNLFSRKPLVNRLDVHLTTGVLCDLPHAVAAAQIDIGPFDGLHGLDLQQLEHTMDCLEDSAIS